jgi:hypothetical protein
VLSAIREFVRLQRTLLEALSAQFAMGAGGLDEGLRSIPRTGTIAPGPDVWHYRSHGGGVAFQAAGAGTLVDVHVLPDEPEVFDGWRLCLYFGSLRGPGRKVWMRSLGSEPARLQRLSRG